MSDAVQTPVFREVFANLLVHEGMTLSTASADSGNWTGGKIGEGQLRGSKFGISAASYPDTDIAGLTEADAADIYLRDYWGPIRGDDLPPRIATVVFDHAVNGGVGTAIRCLQFCVAVPTDGELGPRTLGAVQTFVARNGADALCTALLTRRLMGLTQMRVWASFGAVWCRRIVTVAFQSAAMAE